MRFRLTGRARQRPPMSRLSLRYHEKKRAPGKYALHGAVWRHIDVFEWFIRYINRLNSTCRLMDRRLETVGRRIWACPARSQLQAKSVAL
jgi:hypothetical protein